MSQIASGGDEVDVYLARRQDLLTVLLDKSVREEQPNRSISNDEHGQWSLQ
jgi:hypothetical protein